MRGLAANYKYYQALWFAFDDKKALVKSEAIMRSVPPQSKQYFLSNL